MDFHGDRAIWPRSDNTVWPLVIVHLIRVCRGSRSPKPRLTRGDTLSEQTTRRKRKETIAGRKTTGCHRGHSTGRYLYIFASSGFRKGDFFSDRESGSKLFIHTLISSKFNELTGPET